MTSCSTDAGTSARSICCPNCAGRVSSRSGRTGSGCGCTISTLSQAIVAETGVDEAAADLPFRLVESLVNMWTKRPGTERTKLPEHVADACIRVLGMPDSATPGLRARSHLELRRYAAGN